MTTAPYGTWRSPITAAVVAAQGLRLGFVAIDGNDLYWIEGRPNEAGRNVLVRRSIDGAIADITPAPFNVRSRVHEYGGGAYVVRNGVVYFSNFSDQRIYQVRLKADTTEPTALTPEGAWFYADFEVDARRQQLICVREDHTVDGREPENALVSVSTDDGAVRVIASGYDFYSTPRLAPDGARLCWLCWRHPNMPWDGTELWVADVAPDGSLENQRHVAGGPAESIYQPGWGSDGSLYYASDRSGWWHIYADGDRLITSDPALREVEFGRPQWTFGTATWAFADRETMVVAYARGGRWLLGALDVTSGRMRPLASGLEPGEWLAVNGATALMVAGSPSHPPSVARVDVASGTATVVRSSSSATIDPGYLSEPEAIEFPTDRGVTAHAFYYPPRNRDVEPPADERPPLIVISHGGPTTAAKTMLELAIQFWTSRGIGVVDVNYGGSSGYGRAYRQRLNGQWGIVDVADCVNAATHLVSLGKADARRLAIRGGSAGGYTTLAALTFHPGVFGAGASYYGISDIEVLAQDTHKFESRYLDTLVGPYPEARDVYRARSPIHFVDRLASPLILLQGLEDKVVPPNQAQMMADAVRAKGLPVKLLLFEGEQHGFRRAETIVRSLEAELSFYGEVFGFTPV
ncbi:MAG: prolyl oligopeptidase family serine peptidase [Vicinamibacterales bacterium]